MKRYLYIMVLIVPCLLHAAVPGQDLIKMLDQRGNPILDSKGNPIYIPKTRVINQGESIGATFPGQNVVIKTQWLDEKGNPVYVPAPRPAYDPIPGLDY